MSKPVETISIPAGQGALINAAIWENEVQQCIDFTLGVKICARIGAEANVIDHAEFGKHLPPFRNQDQTVSGDAAGRK